MSLVAVIILAVVLGAVWRLVRLTIRLALIAAVVAAGGFYLHQHTHQAGATGPSTNRVVHRRTPRATEPRDRHLEIHRPPGGVVQRHGEAPWHAIERLDGSHDPALRSNERRRRR